jgi:hypothetical protein
MYRLTPLAVTLIAVPLLLSAAPSGLPRCADGDVLVAHKGNFTCGNLDSLLSERMGALLKAQQPHGSWGAELLLPSCDNGQLLQAESAGRWRCSDPAEVLPSCSSGEVLVAEGSRRFGCQRLPSLPHCSSGEQLVSSGGGEWSCAAAH